MSSEEQIASIATLVLDQLQDYVSEATGEPWPGTATHPLPNSRVQGSTLYLWYGEQDNPALVCPPISIAEFIALAGNDLRHGR